MINHEMYCLSSLFSPSNTKEKEQYISLILWFILYFDKSKLLIRNTCTQKPVLYICLNISESKYLFQSKKLVEDKNVYLYNIYIFWLRFSLVNAINDISKG